MPPPPEGEGGAAAQAAWQRAYARAAALPRFPSAWPQATGRGLSDALAAWRHWHDPKADAEFTASIWPWYAALERGRVEILASRHLPGVAHNLSEIDALLPQTATLAPLYRMARILLEGGNLPEPKTTQPSFLQRFLQRRSRVREVSLAAIAAALFETTDLEDGIGFALKMRPLLPDLAEVDENLPELQDPDQEIEDESGEARAGDSGQEAREERRGPVCPGYAIYSRQWDQTLVARGSNLTLSHLDEAQRRQVRHLAHRLQRRLLAARLRHWRFDQEEGLLDSRRLARLLTPGQTAVFRQESEAWVPEACVTLLVDQSGSMRGARMEMAILALDLAVQTLEASHVRSEVLGYTTRYRAGENPVLSAWRASGSPDDPGRLNALQHWIYKSAEQPWRGVRKNLSGLLQPGRENIDGEALEWASARLLRRPEARKVLLVLSDGTPYDEATVQAHGRSYLETHLHAVIARIEKESCIHLAAIGSGQTVGRFYRHAFTLNQPGEVAERLFAHLGEVLTAHG